MSKNFNNNNVFGERDHISEPPPSYLAAPDERSREVYVVEDDDALRRTIVRILHRAQLTPHAYERATDFLDDAPGLPAGCLVTDFNMPGVDGLELIRRVRAARLPFSAILITGEAYVRLAVDAMKTGASDVLEKPFDGETLLHAITRALKAGPAAIRGEGAREAPWVAALTRREREVLEGVVAGGTNKVIARSLHISPRTVEVYRASLMRKTGAATFSELVQRAVAGGVGRPSGAAARVTD